jgi:hypothetical protein
MDKEMNMVNFYELGRAHFEACEGLHSFMKLEELYGARPDDAWDYLNGFEDAWEAHDENILREEKPWLFYDPCSWHGHVKAREIFL